MTSCILADPTFGRIVMNRYLTFIQHHSYEAKVKHFVEEVILQAISFFDICKFE